MAMTLAPRRYGGQVQRTPPFVRRPALISSVLAPVFFIGGTLVAEALSPGFDPVRQTISELAAVDAPTQVFMTLMFVLTGVCHLITAGYTPGLWLPGRIALALWPVLSMRLGRQYPWLLRPAGAVLSTLVVGAACVAFAWIEAQPDATLVGLAERVAAYLESAWPAVVVLVLWRHQRRERGASLSAR